MSAPLPGTPELLDTLKGPVSVLHREPDIKYLSWLYKCGRHKPASTYWPSASLVSEETASSRRFRAQCFAGSQSVCGNKVGFYTT